MNGIELNNQSRHDEHHRRVQYVDAVAIRAALVGDRKALTVLEQGAAIRICDVYQLDQATVARGLAVCDRTIERRIRDQRNQIVTPQALKFLAEAAREPVTTLIDAVADGDGVAVAQVLRGCDAMQLTTLVIVLASLAADARTRQEAGDAH